MFAEVPFEQYRKLTPRERFLDKMNRVVSWVGLVVIIKPGYSKANRSGRQKVRVEELLRLHCL